MAKEHLCLLLLGAFVMLLATAGAIATEAEENNNYSPMYMYRYSQNLDSIGITPYEDEKEEWSDSCIETTILNANIEELSAVEDDAAPMITTWTTPTVTCRMKVLACTDATSNCNCS